MANIPLIAFAVCVGGVIVLMCVLLTCTCRRDRRQNGENMLLVGAEHPIIHSAVAPV